MLASDRAIGVLDLSVALTVAALELSDPLLFNTQAHGPLTVCLSLGSTLPLALWRRWPFLALQLTGSATVALAALNDPHLGLGPIVATFAVAYWSGPTARRAAACLLALTAWVVPLLTNDPTGIPRNAALFGGAWILGALMRERSATNATLELQAAELRHERELRAALAAEMERARIARELHDVLTHSISVIVIQAQAAQTPGAQPDQISTALSRIETVGKQSLTELRALLRNVRDQDPSSDRSPQPGLARLEDLFAHVQAAGLQVSFTQQGTASPLPATIELSAYRIIQEALTNTIRHSNSPTATVAVHYLRDELTVEVLDNGTTTPRPAAGGHGLAGMRERVTLLNGKLITETRPHGGYRVCAHLPLQVEV